jgi:plastocyanin
MNRVSLALLGVLFGCSSPSPTNDGGMDSGGMDSGGMDTAMEAAVVNGCTAFTDDTASATPTITGPSTSTPAQFTPNCVHIKVGQSVTWNVNMGPHPLGASGGNTPTPIQTTMTGTTVTFAFPNAGTFGFQCQNHPGTMFGAVEVTP